MARERSGVEGAGAGAEVDVAFRDNNSKQNGGAGTWNCRFCLFELEGQYCMHGFWEGLPWLSDERLDPAGSEHPMPRGLASGRGWRKTEPRAPRG